MVATIGDARLEGVSLLWVLFTENTGVGYVEAAVGRDVIKEDRSEGVSPSNPLSGRVGGVLANAWHRHLSSLA